ncbi:hypothetical protein CCMA1212_002198, partial [Trichoderma ghanense]
SLALDQAPVLPPCELRASLVVSRLSSNATDHPTSSELTVCRDHAVCRFHVDQPPHTELSTANYQPLSWNTYRA